MGAFGCPFAVLEYLSLISYMSTFSELLLVLGDVSPPPILFITRMVRLNLPCHLACYLNSTIPVELTAGAIIISFWDPNTSSAAYITPLWVTMIVVNLAGVRWYGEIEYWSSALKIIAIVAFIMCVLPRLFPLPSPQDLTTYPSCSPQHGDRL